MTQTNTANLRETVLQEMRTYVSILRQLNMDQQADSMEAKIAEYDQGLFQVLFTGGFSAGKSTTLNALTRRQLLKTSVKPETAVLAKIVNGKNSSMVTVTYRDLERPDTVMPYDQFKEEFRLDDENSEKFKEVAYVTVTNEMRNKSIALVDSPGLSHTKQDNAIANDFADRADAIVFLLNATQLGTEDEQEYIEKRFAYKGLRNVFFVANWYNTVKPEDEEEFRVHLKNVIGSAFKSEDGTFDEELYKQRVFLVDAYTSECARTGQNKKIRKGIRFVEEVVSPDEDAYTGIPEFEQSLFEFLDSPEKEKEAFKGYMPQMARFYSAAKGLVDARAENAKLSLSELLAKQAEQEENIRKLERVITDIQSAYNRTIREILINIGIGYDDFARSVDNNWNAHFNESSIPFGMKEGAKLGALKTKYLLGNAWNKITGKPGASSMAEDPEFREIVAPIGKAIEEYLKDESQKMVQSIMANSQPAIDRLEADVRNTVDDLNDIDLSGIDLSVLGIEPNVNSDGMTKDANVAQMLIALLLGGNIEQVVNGIVGGGQSWGEFLKDYIATELLEVLLINAVAFLIGPVVWAYLLARGIWGIWKSGKKVENLGVKVVLESRETVVEQIREQRDAQIYKIQQKIQREINKNGDEALKGFMASLKQQQADLEKTIKEKQQGEQDNARDLKYFNNLKDELLDQFNRLSMLISDRSYDEKGVIACCVETKEK